MSEGQSQRSIASSARHRQEAKVAATEERERAATETAATAVRLAMAELAAARAEVEAAAVADAARAAAAELEALHASSTGNPVSADDDRDNELKLAREAAREHVAQWAVAHTRGAVAAAQTGANAPTELRAGARVVAMVQTGADVSGAGLTEIAAFTGGATLPPRAGTMVTMGSRPLSGTSVLAAGGLPQPRPTTSSGPR
jgi:hypothetical protein